MPSKANWLEQLSMEFNDAQRRRAAADQRHGLALLLQRTEPDFKGIDDLVIATRTAACSAHLLEDDATVRLEAAKTYIGDDGGLSDVQQGRIVAGTGKEIEALRSVAREPTAEAMQVQLSAKYATD